MGVAIRGRHGINAYSKTQTTVSLSSAEAELSGIVRGASHGLGFQAIASDLGWDMSIQLWSGATAAIWICRRRGLGRVRHLAVADLWIQERLRAGDFRLDKILGSQNPADALTKHVDRPTLTKLMPMLNLFPEGGRAETAPELVQNVMVCLRTKWRRQ